MATLADDISAKFSSFDGFANKIGLGSSNEMKDSEFERGDLDAFLEKRIKSFGDVLVDIQRLKVKLTPIVKRFFLQMAAQLSVKGGASVFSARDI